MTIMFLISFVNWLWLIEGRTRLSVIIFLQTATPVRRTTGNERATQIIRNSFAGQTGSFIRTRLHRPIRRVSLGHTDHRVAQSVSLSHVVDIDATVFIDTLSIAVKLVDVFVIERDTR